MNIHIDPARYGNEQSIITIKLDPKLMVSDIVAEAKRLQFLYQDAEFTFNRIALGAAAEDMFNETP